MTDRIHALLFDLGGVILEIDFNRVFEIWSAHSGVPAPVITSRFRFDAFYESHERGQITANAYFESLHASLGIRLSDEQFTEGWNAIFRGEVPGVADLLRRSKELLPLYVFSNSNPTHHAYWASEFADTLGNFKAVFVSCDLGRRKPEPEAFAAVASAIGVPFENILFLDDTDENVTTARRLGMQAVHVKSIADIQNALGIPAAGTSKRASTK